MYKQFRKEIRNYKKELGSYRGLLSDLDMDIKIEKFPQLFDNTDSTGFDAHYTYQGPWVMRKLLQNKPKKHIDIGSWVTYLGFFSALQPTEFIDIRPAELDIPNLAPKKGSVLDIPYKSGSVESLSCLHVIEHVGLGRYGDPLDPLGTIKATKELSRVLKKGGHLYVSLPVGEEITYFNAHRVTDPQKVESMFGSLKLVSLSAVKDDRTYLDSVSAKDLQEQKYALGMYHFTK